MRWIAAVLGFGNLVAASALIWVVGSLGHAQGSGLQVTDLTYGLVDTDGDGTCTFGDDWLLAFLVESAPDHLNEALKAAQRRPGGVIDLSPYLQTRTADVVRMERGE